MKKTLLILIAVLFFCISLVVSCSREKLSGEHSMSLQEEIAIVNNSDYLDMNPIPEEETWLEFLSSVEGGDPAGLAIKLSIREICGCEVGNVYTNGISIKKHRELSAGVADGSISCPCMLDDGVDEHSGGFLVARN
ncbi:MAG: hypothetical protein ACI83D_000105 [Planctomycetota bacterium]|jgi:hypothetical protein